MMGGATLKVALTGAIGSGKSRVAELFRVLGARVIDADEIGFHLLEPFEPGWSALRERFADRFFNDDQTVNRSKLRETIFGDKAIRKEVDTLLHPLIKQTIDEICSGAAAQGKGSSDQTHSSSFTLVEVPLLYEAGWQDEFNLVIVVAADVETCLERVMARDGVDRVAALAAFKAQMGLSEKIGMADYVIDNSGEIEATARQVEKIYAEIVK